MATRSREDAVAQAGKGVFCPCGKMCRGPMYESSPGWWQVGPVLPGSASFSVLRRVTPSPDAPVNDTADETFVQRYCPDCSVVIFDTLAEFGLDYAGKHKVPDSKPRPSVEYRRAVRVHVTRGG